MAQISMNADPNGARKTQRHGVNSCWRCGYYNEGGDPKHLLIFDGRFKFNKLICKNCLSDTEKAIICMICTEQSERNYFYDSINDIGGKIVTRYICNACFEHGRKEKCVYIYEDQCKTGSYSRIACLCERSAVYQNPPCCGSGHKICGKCNQGTSCEHKHHWSKSQPEKRENLCAECAVDDIFK